MDTIAIISLKFNAGHFSHLTANYTLISNLHRNCILYVNHKFNDLDKDSKYRICNSLSIQDYSDVSCAIFWFPSWKNIFEIVKFKFFGSAKIIYVFHEPISSYLEFYKAGFSSFKLTRIYFINIVNKILVLSANHILLPSKKAFEVYSKNYFVLNKRITLIPLLFDDENENPESNIQKRKYISYIGTIASDHAFSKFVGYLNFAITNNLFTDYTFLIATSSKLSSELKEKLNKHQELGRLIVIDGSWLTNIEINEYFSKSVVVWNAYDRSTQSGILPKAFMFGTPVLGNARIPNEYLIDRQNGIYLESNTNFPEITGAIKDIIYNFGIYSKNCRQFFLNTFYYDNYLSHFTKIINNE